MIKSMTTTENEYLKQCNQPSDINEHLPTIKQYADDCVTCTEMGVRSGASTWAFLNSKCEKLISYDIVKHPNIEYIKMVCSDDSRYIFKECDVLTTEIEKTDLLFIDTLHTYNQLISELTKHSTQVLKYIILHDTVTYGYTDEAIYNHASEVIKNKYSDYKGLVPAIKHFSKTEDGVNWKLKEHYINNNGLTILERI